MSLKRNTAPGFAVDAETVYDIMPALRIIISYTVSIVPPLNSVLFLKIWEKRVKIWGKEPIRITQAVCIHLDSDIAA